VDEIVATTSRATAAVFQKMTDAGATPSLPVKPVQYRLVDSALVATASPDVNETGFVPVPDVLTSTASAISTTSAISAAIVRR
jgi:hypothetical protein